MGTQRVTGSSMEDSERSAAASLSDALEAAVQAGPPSSNDHRTYEITRAWFQAGGVVGKRIYYVELEVSGSDVPGGET